MASDKNEQKQQVFDSKETKPMTPQERFGALRDLRKAAEAGEMGLLKQLATQWERLKLSSDIHFTLLKAMLKASNDDAFRFLLPLVSLHDKQALELLESIALGSWEREQKRAASKALTDKEFSREVDKRNWLKKRFTHSKVKVSLPPHFNALITGDIDVTRLAKDLPQQRDSSGNSIVHYLSANGRLEALKALKSCSPDLFATLTCYTQTQSSYIRLPIYDDASIPRISKTEPYINGIFFPWEPLFLAIENGHIDVMGWWLKQTEGKKIQQYNFQPHEPCTHNAFLWAIQKGYLKTAKWLIAKWEQNGMTLEQRNPLLGTALLIAVNQTHLKIVKWLVDGEKIGLNISTVFKQLNSFSDDTIRKKLEKLSSPLENSPAWGKYKRPDSVDHKNFLFLSELSVRLCGGGERPWNSEAQDIAECFIYACDKGGDAEVDFNVNGGNFAERAIVYAASQGKTEVVKLLIPRGKPGANLLSNTIRYASTYGDPNTLKLLLNVFSTLESGTEKSTLRVAPHVSALIEAAMVGHRSIVAWLVSTYGLNPQDIPQIAELLAWGEAEAPRNFRRTLVADDWKTILERLARAESLFNAPTTPEEQFRIETLIKSERLHYIDYPSQTEISKIAAELERLNNVYLAPHIASIKENLTATGFTTAVLQTIITDYTCVPTIAEALAPVYAAPNQTKASASTSSNNSESKKATANTESAVAQTESTHNAATKIAEHLNAIDEGIQLIGVDSSTFNKEISNETITTLQEKYREYKFSTSSSTTTSSPSYSLHATRKTPQELTASARSGSFSYSERGSQSFPPPSPKVQGDAGEKRETKEEAKGSVPTTDSVVEDNLSVGENTRSSSETNGVVDVNSSTEKNISSATRHRSS